MNEEELIQETRKLIGQWDNIRIVGLGWAGDSRRGFQFNPTDARTGGGGFSPPPPPPTNTGACCPESGDCFISTQSVCEEGGGTYQGDDTTCDPDPCPPKGACCVGIDCTIETEDDCTGMGGTYQGDDTTCDPNPCVMPECSCGFDAFDGSGRRFLTRTTITTLNTTVVCPCGVSEDIGSWTCTNTYDPVTCELTSTTTGSETATDCDGNVIHPDARCDCFGDVESATVLHFQFIDQEGCAHIDTESTCTLSEECTPV